MTVVSIRLSSDEENLLKKMASSEGIGLSSYIKKIVFERLEEEYDLRLAEKSYKEHIESNGKTHSFQSVVEELSNGNKRG